MLAAVSGSSFLMKKPAFSETKYDGYTVKNYNGANKNKEIYFSHGAVANIFKKLEELKLESTTITDGLKIPETIIQIANGVRHGKFLAYYPDTYLTKYTGEYKDGKMCGNFTMFENKETSPKVIKTANYFKGRCCELTDNGVDYSIDVTRCKLHFNWKDVVELTLERTSKFIELRFNGGDVYTITRVHGNERDEFIKQHNQSTPYGLVHDIIRKNGKIIAKKLYNERRVFVTEIFDDNSVLRTYKNFNLHSDEYTIKEYSSTAELISSTRSSSKCKHVYDVDFDFNISNYNFFQDFEKTEICDELKQRINTLKECLDRHVI